MWLKKKKITSVFPICQKIDSPPGRAAHTGIRKLTLNGRRKQRSGEEWRQSVKSQRRRRFLGLFGKGAIHAAPQPKSSVLKRRTRTYTCREDFPGGPVVKNLPASAGHVGSISGPGRFHTSLSQLSPCTQLLEPSFLEPLLFNKRSHCNVKPAPHSYRKAFAASKTQHSQNKNKKIFKRTLSPELLLSFYWTLLLVVGGGVSMCNFFNVKYRKHSREVSILKKERLKIRRRVHN